MLEGLYYMTINSCQANIGVCALVCVVYYTICFILLLQVLWVFNTEQRCPSREMPIKMLQINSIKEHHD